MTNTLTLREALHDLPQLPTERLLLRRITPEDASDIFAYSSDPAVTAKLSWETHLSIDDTSMFIDWVIGQYARGEGAIWGIEHLGTGRCIGTISYNSTRAGDYVAECGYALARPFWGQGLMTEALMAVLDYGFRHMGLRRVEAICRLNNIGSYRVMEKCGMQLDGVLQDSHYVKGSLVSIRLYSLLRRDYERAHRSGHFGRLQDTSGAGDAPHPIAEGGSQRRP